MKQVLLFIPLLAVWTAGPAPAPDQSTGTRATGSVSGRIELHAMHGEGSGQSAPRHHAYGMASMQMHASAPPNEFENMVVSLDGDALRSSAPPARRHAVINQQNAEFLPHVLPVQRGTVVDFINCDHVYHNVFSLSPAKRFNIGRRPTGQAVPITFEKPGIVEVFCDIHSNMSAYILVMENEFFVCPDAKGNYSIDHVPVGTYTLKVWHERYGQQERTITISADSMTTANFLLE